MNTEVKTGRTKSGRRFIEWVYRNYTPEMALRNLQRIRVSYYINFFYSDILRNNETGAELEFYHHTKTRLIKTRAQARNFLNEQTRDSNAKPNTKWQFVRSGIVNVKVTFTRQPLMGVGLLPQWLRTLAEHGHHMYTLDTYNDNLCGAVSQYTEARVTTGRPARQRRWPAGFTKSRQSRKHRWKTSGKSRIS